MLTSTRFPPAGINANAALGNGRFRFSSLSPGQVFIFVDSVTAGLDCDGNECRRVWPHERGPAAPALRVKSAFNVVAMGDKAVARTGPSAQCPQAWHALSGTAQT
jgi:hypothetical protein